MRMERDFNLTWNDKTNRYHIELVHNRIPEFSPEVYTYFKDKYGDGFRYETALESMGFPEDDAKLIATYWREIEDI